MNTDDQRAANNVFIGGYFFADVMRSVFFVSFCVRIKCCPIFDKILVP